MQSKYVDIHSHIRGVKDNDIISHPTFSIAEDDVFSYKEQFWCGLHPWDSSKISCEQMLERFQTVKNNMIGIGEIGLDYTIKNDFKIQRTIFECQLDYAIENNLPVTIHCVKAYNDIVQIIRAKEAKKVIIHSFASHPIVALQLLDIGCYLSFSDRSLRSKKSVEALVRVPFERLFLETDNEEKKEKNTIKQLYKNVALIRGVSLEELKKQLYNNYLCLIG